MSLMIFESRHARLRAFGALPVAAAAAVSLYFICRAAQMMFVIASAREEASQREAASIVTAISLGRRAFLLEPLRSSSRARAARRWSPSAMPACRRFWKPFTPASRQAKLQE